MNRLIRIFLLTSFAVSLTACASSSERLANAGNLPPIDKINVKLQKYIYKLSSDDATERAWAVYKIGKSSKIAANTEPYLVALLDDTDEAIMTRYVGKDYSSATTTTTANEAVKALGKIGKSSVEFLLTALKDSNSEVVIMAIKALGTIRDNKSIKPLVLFLNNKNKRIRLEAANSLSRFNNPWITDYLLTTLKNKNPSVRSTALYALGKLKNPAAVPSLLALLNDTDRSIRSQTLYVLSHYRDERIIQPLINEEKKARGKDTNYRIEIIGTLGNIRDYRVIEVLLSILDEPNKNIKIAAAQALAQIADADFGVNPAKWKLWWANKLKRSGKK